MKKIKILFEYTPGYRNDKTGIPYFVQQLYSKLEKEQSLIITKTVNISEFIPTKPYYFFKFFEKIIYKKIYLPLKLIFGRYDIYIETNYMFCPIIKPKNTLIFNIVYDIGLILYDNIQTSYITNKWRNRFLKTLKYTDVIITISKTSKNDIKDYIKSNKISNKIPIEYIYIDTSNSISVPLKYKEYLKKLRVEKPYILFLGTIEPRKNLLNTVKAFYKFKETYNTNFKLIIAGKKGWLYKDIIDFIDNNNLDNDIIFTGYITDDEKMSLLQEAELFIFLSKYEGFGMPPLEALKMGKKVLLSNIPIFKELYGDYAFFVDYNNIETIAKKIFESINTEKIINYDILDKYSWNKTSDKFLSILNKYLNDERKIYG